MNILSIDYGAKNIGLAWVNTELGVVLPYGKLETGNWKLGLVKLIRDEKIDTVVVGLPLGLDGKENENTKRVRAFVAELKKYIDRPIALIDERFSTAEAKRMGGDASPDEKAAMIILQSYLEKQQL